MVFSFGQTYAVNKKKECGGSLSAYYEEYRQKRGRLLKKMIEHGFIWMPLDKAGIVEKLSDAAYRSGALDTVYGFYETVQLGPKNMHSRLEVFYGKDNQGLEEMIKKVEELLGPKIVRRYQELKRYIHE